MLFEHLVYQPEAPRRSDRRARRVGRAGRVLEPRGRAARGGRRAWSRRPRSPSTRRAPQGSAGTDRRLGAGWPARRTLRGRDRSARTPAGGVRRSRERGLGAGVGVALGEALSSSPAPVASKPMRKTCRRRHAFYPIFLLTSQYMQRVLDFSALDAGLAFVPMALATMLFSGVCPTSSSPPSAFGATSSPRWR